MKYFLQPEGAHRFKSQRGSDVRARKVNDVEIIEQLIGFSTSRRKKNSSSFFTSSLFLTLRLIYLLFLFECEKYLSSQST